VNRFRGRSGAGSAPAHGLAPQNLSPDKRVDVCADSGEDRGSTPLASTFALGTKVSAVALAKADGTLSGSKQHSHPLGLEDTNLIVLTEGPIHLLKAAVLEEGSINSRVTAYLLSAIRSKVTVDRRHSREHNHKKHG
jgi:hypothetical protein